MNEEMQLEVPIDVMYLIHKALSSEAAKVQNLIENLEIGGSLQPFRMEFNFWASMLMYHADMEDEHMTGPIPDWQQARDNEAEHVELGDMLGQLETYLQSDDKAGLDEKIRQAIAVIHDEQHLELMEKLEDILAVLGDEIGRTRVVARTKRHLYGKVVAARIAQDDHLEAEEAFVLPEIRERFSEDDQLRLTKILLIDEQSEDPRWVIDWVAQEIDADEREWLMALESRFTKRFELQQNAAD